MADRMGKRKKAEINLGLCFISEEKKLLTRSDCGCKGNIETCFK
jgi:hypothetical protein